MGPEGSSTSEVQQTGSRSRNHRAVDYSLYVAIRCRSWLVGVWRPPCSGSHKLDFSVWFNEPRSWSFYAWWVQSSCWTFPALVTIQISLGAKTCSNSVQMGSLRLCLWTLLQISHGIKDGLTLTRCWWGHPGDQLNWNESRLLKEMARLTEWARPYIPGLPHSWGKDVSPRGTRPVNHKKKQSLTHVAFRWTVKSNSWGFVILL